MAARARAGPAFVAASEKLDNGPSVVRVMGEVDLATVKELERALREARESQTDSVIVDLTGCTFLDSSGLRAMAETRRHLERANRRLALALSNPGVLRIFQITALEHVFETTPRCARRWTAMAPVPKPGYHWRSRVPARASELLNRRWHDLRGHPRPGFLPGLC